MTAWTRHRRPPGTRLGSRWRRTPSWRTLLWRTPPTEVLLAEADRLAAEGRWRPATRLLVAAADRVDGDDGRPVLERLAVAAADAGRHGLSREAVYRLDRLGPHTPSTSVAFANVALARGNHLHADRAARSALAAEPTNREAWLALAAGYGGLGWFDESATCLGPVGADDLADREQFRIGRAVNRWSLAGTGWFVLALLAVPLVGWSAGIVAAIGPLAVRRWRLRHLRRVASGAVLAPMAAAAWRATRSQRSVHGALVASMAVLTVWAALGS